MELVVDSNIIFSALIRNSVTREILLDSGHRFYAPEFLKTEIMKYEELLKKKSGLKIREFETLFRLALEEVEILPIKSYDHKLEKVEEVIGDQDRKDVPFLALVLHKECRVWSAGKDLQK